VWQVHGTTSMDGLSAGVTVESAAMDGTGPGISVLEFH